MLEERVDVSVVVQKSVALRLLLLIHYSEIEVLGNIYPSVCDEMNEMRGLGL